MTDPHTIDALADKVAAASGTLDPAEQHIAVGLVRALAHGEPVSVGELSRALAVPEAQIAEALDRLPLLFRDDRRRVVGFMGLSAEQMGHHRVHVDGRALSTWCAWDTLFLPELLGQTTRVTSRCPTTGQDVSLTVTPSGPTDVRPAEAVVSFLVPETPFDADVIRSFCHFVHFFASPAAGERWIAEHPGTFLLAVPDAFELGRQVNHRRLGAALAAQRTASLTPTGK